MQRQGTIWTGTLPFILGLALLLGCFVCSAEVGAQTADTDVLQPGEPQPSGTPTAVGADDGTGAVSDTTRKKPSKAQRSATKAQPTKAGQVTDSNVVPSVATKQYTGKAISLDLMDADLRNVLRLLSDLAAINIVIEPDVSGKVTLKVEQVPWDQVLDMVLSMNDLGKEQLGNVIRIARQAKLRQEWTQQAEAIRAKQHLVETSRDLGDLSTVYFSVNFGKPADIATKISDGKSERGKVAVDERTSLIIYTDYPARLANARQLLTRLDRPTPQVLIEARIITLTSDTKRQLGINLTVDAKYQPSGAPTVQDFVLNTAAAAARTYGFNIATMVGKTLLNIDLQIQALQSINLARVVAAPRVLTLDNVKAVVTQGTQVPYLKVGDTAANVTATEFKDATLELAVTPHITPDRKVKLVVNAKQDTVSATTYNNEPGIDTRKIQTELLVDDGDVIVIGGVIDNESSATKSVTPGLADIPILGRFFKSEQSEDKRNELLIFISPRIVEVSKPSDKT
ncbi:MAG: type IV pilus secretin PilQ [Syntrophobacteraceae bacterium]